MSDWIYAYFDAWETAYIKFLVWVHNSYLVYEYAGFTKASVKFILKQFESLCGITLIVYLFHVMLVCAIIMVYIDCRYFQD